MFARKYSRFCVKMQTQRYQYYYSQKGFYINDCFDAGIVFVHNVMDNNGKYLTLDNNGKYLTLEKTI